MVRAGKTPLILAQTSAIALLFNKLVYRLTKKFNSYIILLGLLGAQTRGSVIL
jgi:hypothetical protein